MSDESNMIEVALNEATAAQLREYASVVMGLELGKTATAASIISKMRTAGFDGDTIEVSTPDTGAVQNEPGNAVRKASPKLGEKTYYEDGPRDGMPIKIVERTVEVKGKPGEKPKVRKVKLTWINVIVEDKPGGDEPVPAGVNGSVMFIPRGEPVLVPLPYVEALEHARITQFGQFDGSEKSYGLHGSRIVHQYPFNYVSSPAHAGNSGLAA